MELRKAFKEVTSKLDCEGLIDVYQAERKGAGIRAETRAFAKKGMGCDRAGLLRESGLAGGGVTG